MTNQIQLPARFANRQNRRNLVQAVTAGLGMASPPYVSIKGGMFTLIDANGEQEPVETKYLDCVIIDTQRPDQGEATVQRVFWGSKVFNPNADAYEPPDCWSDNGIGASANAIDPQSQSCQTCPQNTWGSAVSKVTGKPIKACHVIKKVAIVPVELKQDAKGVPIYSDGGMVTAEHIEDFPFLLRVPVMSHENLRAYSSKFAGQNFDISEVVTRITFVHGQVGQLDFQSAGFTDEATETAVQKYLAAKMTDALVGRGDRPWTGSLPAPAQQAQIEKPQQAPSSVQGEPFKQQEETSAKRGRKSRTAPQEAAQSDSGGIPPFLQRAAQTQPNGPAGGIVHGASAPNAELEAALVNVFGLKT